MNADIWFKHIFDSFNNIDIQEIWEILKEFIYSEYLATFFPWSVIQDEFYHGNIAFGSDTIARKSIKM